MTETMQGYQRPILKLVWPEDSEFHGLEVRVRRLSIGALLEIAEMETGTTEANAVERLDKLVTKVSKMIVSWNLLDDDGEQVPTTPDGIKTGDEQLLYAIISTTTDLMVGAKPPLPQPSTDGEQSLEASIPMETLSGNPLSSETPA
jgi:hypothetical protein